MLVRADYGDRNNRADERSVTGEIDDAVAGRPAEQLVTPLADPLNEHLLTASHKAPIVFEGSLPLE